MHTYIHAYIQTYINKQNKTQRKQIYIYHMYIIHRHTYIHINIHKQTKQNTTKTCLHRLLQHRIDEGGDENDKGKVYIP